MNNTTVVPANSRGGRVLLHNGYRYVRKSKSTSQLRWICTVRGCGSIAYTNVFDVYADDPNIVVTRLDLHSHGADEIAARRGILLKSMHQKITNNPTIPVHRVYEAVVDNDSGDSDDIQQFHTFRSRLKRYRSHFVPPIPVNIADVYIQGQWSKTRSGRTFLSKLDNLWGIAIFTTSTLLIALKNCECTYIDGTFRTAPHPYVQFVTVHGLYNGFVVPLVFCLLDGKTVGQYQQMLKHLKHEVRRVTGRPWTPDRFVVDFERSMFLAIERELPGVPISGCYFHFTQSLWRHIQNDGLGYAYRHSRRLRNTVRKVLAIGFLPVLLVRQNFLLLRNSRRTQRLVQQYPELDYWFEYVQSTYVDNSAAFPPPTWNVYRRDSNTRTNNHVEGFHNRWNRLVQVRHPNIWIFIRQLKDEERHSRRILHSADRGDTPPITKRRYRMLEERIDSLKRDYRRGRRTVEAYWRAVVHAVHEFH